MECLLVWLDRLLQQVAWGVKKVARLLRGVGGDGGDGADENVAWTAVPTGGVHEAV